MPADEGVFAEQRTMAGRDAIKYGGEFVKRFEALQDR